MAFNLNDSFFEEVNFPNLSDSEEKKMAKEPLPEALPLLPLKNTVLYPGVVIPITVGRDKSIQAVKAAYNSKEKLIGVVAQRQLNIEEPEAEDLYSIGTIARIHKLFKMPDGSVTIVIQGRNRFAIDSFLQEDPFFKVQIAKLHDFYPTKQASTALMRTLKRQAEKIIEISPNLPTEAAIALKNISNLSFLVHFIASNLSIEVREKQEILELAPLQDKGELVLNYMVKELAVLEISEEIQSKVRSDLDKQQREYFLRQQMKTIQGELGDDGPETDIDNFKQRALEKRWPKHVQEVFDKECHRLTRLNPNMPDYAVLINYLEWLLDLPWENYTTDDFEFKKVRDILDKDHYGLEKVKERILEHLAVLKLKSDKKSPIICFVGPPGVGKTSLGKSIARALNREFVRISLGGVHDEAEIRGHRRTYIGALPGRIIQGLKKTKSGNPVFMLDEIDKVGSDQRGDPSSALLEVLDPEQNNSFQDHFLEVEYDLSRIMFIATANTLGTIHPALLDRMEIIEISGYSLEEKLEIAKRHLVPEKRKDHGLSAKNLKISDSALKRMIDGYTRESGVRKLAQQVSGVCRVAAKEIVFNDAKAVSVSPKNLEDFLGLPRFESQLYKKINVPGVSVGLAWTQVGGDILFFETALTPGTGKLNLTGQLGSVMKESASLAYTYVQANADKLNIPSEVFNQWDLHIHCPAGAIPKDGPSAGVTMMTAIASIFTQRLVTPNLAMTGEITLRGRVLPVGGIKEKVLAARRAGLTTLILPRENKKDFSEIKEEYVKDMEVHFVEEMNEVLSLALEKQKIAKPLNLQPSQKDQKEKSSASKKLRYQA